jgi:urease accessory protein
MATDHASLLLLLNWMSPTFPIGTFAYSHGLEQAIVDGRITTAAEVEDWIAELLQRGSGWNDAVVFAQCWSTPVEELIWKQRILAATSMSQHLFGRVLRKVKQTWPILLLRAKPAS